MATDWQAQFFEDTKADDGPSSSGSSSSSTSFSGGSFTDRLRKVVDSTPDGGSSASSTARIEDRLRKVVDSTPEAPSDPASRSPADLSTRIPTRQRNVDTSRPKQQGLAGKVTAFIDKTTGASKWAKSEDAAELRRRNREAGGGITGSLKRFDNSTRAGLDFLLDNPNASAQEGLQEVAKAPTELLTGRQVSDEELAGSAKNLADRFKSATQGKVAEGTIIDNAGTEAVVDVGTFLGEAVVADPAKAGIRGLTGVDVDEGDTEGTVGAIDAFDIGVTVGTAGAGKAATSLLRGAGKADEAGTLASRVASRFGQGGDEAAQTVDDAAQGDGALDAFSPSGGDSLGTDIFGRLTRGGETVSDGGVADGVASVVDESAGNFRKVLDDVAGGTDDAATVTDDAASTVDDATGSTQQAVDEAISAVDDTTGTTDEASSGFRSILDDTLGGSDDAASTVDDVAGGTDDATDDAVREAVEAAEDGSTAVDDGGSLLDDVTSRIPGLSDDAARLSDEAAQASDEVAQTADDVADASGGFNWKLPAVLTGGLFAGGLLGSGLLDPTDAPKEIDTASGHSLVYAKDYEPVEKYPNGGRLYAVTKDFQNLGYWLLLGIQGRNLIVLDESGDPRRAKIDAEQFKQLMGQQGNQQQAGGNA